MTSAERVNQGAIVAEGDFRFTPGNFAHIAKLLQAETGIFLNEGKATLVYSRLGKRLRQLGLTSFSDYCALVESPEGAEERGLMISALTTNVTRFFREPHHFEHFKQQVLPGLSRAAKAGDRVRIWSSACSTGEEPYSIALTVLDSMPDAARHDFRILATDIDPKVVATGRAGVYRTDALAPVARAQRDRWFEKNRDRPDSWRAREELRALILFKELNLIGDWPLRGPFDVIFCRNVVIYFEEPTQLRLWGRFRDLLAPGGRLYVGHSERVDIPGLESDGLTVYRKSEQVRP